MSYLLMDHPQPNWSRMIIYESVYKAYIMHIQIHPLCMRCLEQPKCERKPDIK